MQIEHIIWKDSPTEVAARQVNLRCDAQVTASELAEAIRLHTGLSAVVRIINIRVGIYNVTFDEGATPTTVDLVEKLSILPGVRWAEPNRIARSCANLGEGVSDRPSAVAPARSQYQWSLSRLGASLAWRVTTGSASVKIAILDSGIWLNEDGAVAHPNFNPKLITLGKNYVTPYGTVADDYGHGTAVAGIICADPAYPGGIVGMSSASQVIIEKVSDNRGEVFEDSLCEAISDVFDRTVVVGYDVIINISLGLQGSSTIITDTCRFIDQYNSDPTHNCAIVCTGSGNDGVDEMLTPASVSRLYPDTVVSVGAIKVDGLVDYYSSWGKGLTCVAPGTSILTTSLQRNGVGPLYRPVDGTSFAAPHVSGILSLIWSYLHANRIPLQGSPRASTVIDILRSNCCLPNLIDSVDIPKYGSGLACALVNNDFCPALVEFET